MTEQDLEELERVAKAACVAIQAFAETTHEDGSQEWKLLHYEAERAKRNFDHEFTCAKAVRLLSLLRSQAQEIEELRKGGWRPDEVTEDEIRRRARALIRSKGWTAAQRPSGWHSIIELMVALGMDLTARPATDRCAYPDCGCQWDAVCNTALDKMQRAAPPRDPQVEGEGHD